ncbi:unnamed protein product, partial [Mesorhabditis spiculigera]
MSSDKEQMREAESLRRTAFCGVAISTIATLTCIVAIPALYNYMQHVQSSLQTEVDFCKHRTTGLFEQYERMQVIKGVRGKVVKRQAGYDSPVQAQPSYGDSAVADSSASSEGSCCSCGGPVGDNGHDGQPGAAGQPGADGQSGDQGPKGGCDHCPPPRTAPGY